MREKRQKRESKPQRPYVGDYGAPLTGARAKVAGVAGMLVLSALLGFAAGFVVWAVFSLVSVLTGLVWGTMAGEGPRSLLDAAFAAFESAGAASWWLPIAICTFGGLVIGLFTKHVGGQPDELPRVMGTIRKTGEYRVKGLGRSAVGFLLPLAFGGSIGPEAGLTGIIAGAVCWVGRMLRTAGLKVKGSADIAGVAVSAVLSALFATPFAGIVAAARDAMPRRAGGDGDAKAAQDSAAGSEAPSPSSPRTDRGHAGSGKEPDPLAYDFRIGAKVALYAAAALGAVGGVACVSALLGPSGGLPHFSGATPRVEDLPWFVPCVALGYAGALLFHVGRELFGRLSAALGDRLVLKPVLGGFVLGTVACALPYVLFPGEAQTHELMGGWQALGTGVLIATGLVKCLATPWCLAMGWKGGHFFPCIFAGVACGYGIAALSGAEPVLCVCATTAALVAGIQRSPLMALALLLLCFPLENLPCMLLACVVGAKLPVPRQLLEKEG